MPLLGYVLRNLSQVHLVSEGEIMRKLLLTVLSCLVLSCVCAAQDLEIINIRVGQGDSTLQGNHNPFITLGPEILERAR